MNHQHMNQMNIKQAKDFLIQNGRTLPIHEQPLSYYIDRVIYVKKYLNLLAHKNKNTTNNSWLCKSTTPTKNTIRKRPSRRASDTMLYNKLNNNHQETFASLNESLSKTSKLRMDVRAYVDTTWPTPPITSQHNPNIKRERRGNHKATRVDLMATPECSDNIQTPNNHRYNQRYNQQYNENNIQNTPQTPLTNNNTPNHRYNQYNENTIQYTPQTPLTNNITPNHRYNQYNENTIQNIPQTSLKQNRTPMKLPFKKIEGKKNASKKKKSRMNLKLFIIIIVILFGIIACFLKSDTMNRGGTEQGEYQSKNDVFGINNNKSETENDKS